MSDLISRQDAIEAVEAKAKWFNGDAIEDRCKRDAFISVIDDVLTELPSADRPTGEWVNREKCQVDEDAYEVATCSECEAEITIEYPHDSYCPNCGAYMRKGGVE